MTKAKAQKIIDAKALLTTGISAKETSTTTGLSLAKIYQLKKKLSTPETKETTTSETKTETKPRPTKTETKTKKQKWKGEYIPRNIAGQKTDWDIAIGCHADKTPLLLIGEAGCGKSYLPRKIAEEKNQSYVSVNCNRAITPKQLLGQHVPVKNKKGTLQIDWTDGILTRALKEGSILVLEEVNSAPPEILFILHGLLEENNRKIQLLEKDGEIITAHPDFWLVATMNPAYEGTITLNQAFKDRFTIIESDYNEKAEDIIIDHPKVQEIAKKLRVMKKAGEINTPTSTRQLISYKKNLEKFGEEVAQALFVNSYEDEEKKAVNELFNLVK